MRYLRFILATILFALISGCNSCEKEKPQVPTLKSTGAWEARFQEIDRNVEKIHKDYHASLLHKFNDTDLDQLNCEYPYWEKIHVYLNKEGMNKVIFLSDPKKGNRIEDFYFLKGNLIFARIDKEGLNKLQNQTTQGKRFYFYDKKLVRAIDIKGEFMDINNRNVAIQGLDLLKESEQIKKIIAQKNLRF